MERLRIPGELLRTSYTELRTCGAGRRECQVLWVSPWKQPDLITRVVHPDHRAHGDGFTLDSAWLTQFWLQLGRSGEGVRVQVHTHPAEAFHSITDDTWPIVQTKGFLSLVVPDFAANEPGFDGCFLTELQGDGKWSEVRHIEDRIEVL